MGREKEGGGGGRQQVRSDGMIITYALRSLVAAAVIPPDRYTTITMPRAALFYSLPRAARIRRACSRGWREARVQCVHPAQDVSSQRDALDTSNTLHTARVQVLLPRPRVRCTCLAAMRWPDETPSSGCEAAGGCPGRHRSAYSGGEVPACMRPTCLSGARWRGLRRSGRRAGPAAGV